MVRRSADAITNLAHENVSIKSKVRAEDGIPPLVALLEAYDPKVCVVYLSAINFSTLQKHSSENAEKQNCLPTYTSEWKVSSMQRL